MSNEVRILPGSFPLAVAAFGGGGNNNLVVAIDVPSGLPVHTADKTKGAYISIPLTSNPVGIDTWTISGFSVIVRMAAFVLGGNWARFGDLWAGLTVDDENYGRASTVFPNDWPPVQFPSNLSLVTKMWSGKDDEIGYVNPATEFTDSLYTRIAQTFQLPYPIKVRSGTQLGFALVLTPSTLDGGCALMIKDCNFTIMYSEGRQ